MRKIFVCVLALMLLASTALAESTLTVNGNGSVLVDADRVTINVGVRELAEDVKSAQSAVNARLDAVIAALTGMGIELKDIHTDAISIYPEYDYSSYDDGERIVGYSAYNMISATTADTANAGAYIDAAFDAGANQLNGVEFFAYDTTEARHQALTLAVQNAAEKAQVLAEAAGQKLGAVLAINEGDNYYDAPVALARGAKTEDAGTQVYANQLSVSASVSVQYAITQE